MENLINYFDKVYIINLKKRIDRFEEIKKEFEILGINCPSDKIEIFEAVEPSEKGKWPSIGARGCFFSHFKIIEKAIELKLKRFIIIEDDLSFYKNSKNLNDNILEKLKLENWDLLYLGQNDVENLGKDIIWNRYNKEIKCSHFMAFNSINLKKLRDFLFQISEREEGDPLGGPMHVDGAYNTFRQQNDNINTFILSPPLGFQRPSNSDIAESNSMMYRLFGNKMSNLLRKIKLNYLRNKKFE
ncbi:MAG: glycosyltransferase family 25 protein [Aliarcobacter sp.]|nr:glycosyltransferase family 25 protein [Aliarcobacter sp.]